MTINDVKAVIFDLDGVIVDTAKYHYLAWRKLAGELGFEFTKKDNERLKGVSRMKSLEILLEVGKMSERFSEEEKLAMAAKKNSRYVEYIKKLEKTQMLEGAYEFLKLLRINGIKTALGSASKNSGIILDRLGIADLFDEIVDGNMVSKAKPDPEVFMVAADLLCADYKSCVVFEDAQAGLEAGNAAGMYTIAVGNESDLNGYNEIVTALIGATKTHVFGGLV